MAAGRGLIISGDRADGTQQRLRYGLGEHKPYRYKGIPGWNPARVLAGRQGTRKSRVCDRCGAQPGELCLSNAGKPMRSYHTER
jgi:hypothetical protein